MGDQPDLQGQQAYHTRLESPVDYVPRRVVSLVPGLTESLLDLDLGDRLIAVTGYRLHPADKVKALPQVGTPQALDVRRIIDLQPDLVLANDEENRREEVQALREAGVPLWAVTPRTVFEVLNLLWNLMDLFDHPAMVPRVREIERAYDYTLAVSRVTIPTRVFIPTRRDPWTTFEAGTYAHDVLRICGGEIVFAQSSSTITWDALVEAQPEVMLLPDALFSETDTEALRALDIPAAHDKRIHLIKESLFWCGTPVAYTLRDLPPLLMGSA